MYYADVTPLTLATTQTCLQRERLVLASLLPSNTIQNNLTSIAVVLMRKNY